MAWGSLNTRMNGGPPNKNREENAWMNNDPLNTMRGEKDIRVNGDKRDGEDLEKHRCEGGKQKKAC